MRGQSPLGDLVHAAGAYLHFHPFALRSHHGDMQTFVTVRLRDGDPVFHALRVRLVHVGDDRVDLPAVRTFLLIRRVQDDADGKQVVYVFERDVLLFQFVVDGVDRLGASLDVETESGIFQLAFDRRDELGDVGVARAFRLVQFPFDEVVLLAVGVFQRQVFQFALDRVQSEAVGKRGVQVRNFRRQPFPVFVVLQMFAEAHQAKAVGDHDQDHAHIFGKREQ